MNEQTDRGVYEADRAAALSGVPKSTIYEWARTNLVTPSISPEKVKLWSWGDLVELRAIYWLRHEGAASIGVRKSAPMVAVRAMLEHLRAASRQLGEQLSAGTTRLHLDNSGSIHVIAGERILVFGSAAQSAVELSFDLLASFETTEGAAPDLRRPAAGIRIVPGVLAGEPHLQGTRIETRVLWALKERGFSPESIAQFYPDLDGASVERALELEARLQARGKAA